MAGRVRPLVAEELLLPTGLVVAWVLTSVAAPTFSERVAVLLPETAAGCPIEVSKVEHSLGLYLQGFAFTTHRLTEDDVSSALAVARDSAADLAVWLECGSAVGRPEVNVHTVSLRDLSRLVRFSVPVPEVPQASFYRLVALKLRATIRSLVGLPAPETVLAEEVLAAPADESTTWAVEMIAAGSPAWSPTASLISAGAAVLVLRGSWAHSIELLYGFPRGGSSARADAFRAAISVRRQVLGRSAIRLGLWLGGGAGVALARVQLDAAPSSLGSATPFLRVTTLGAVHLGAHTSVLLGPQLEWTPFPPTANIGEVPLFPVNPLVARLELRLQLAI
jgi:hypothetical protein